MAVLFEIAPLIVYLLCIGIAKFTLVVGVLLRKAFDVHGPKCRNIALFYQGLAQRHIVSSSFGKTCLDVNHP